MGVLLVGSADSGKSTCCRRLPSPWQALCDDETLITVRGQKEYRAHPFPTWSDCLRREPKRSWNVQKHVHLSAIFFLEQAPIDEALPIGEGRAAALIMRSATEVCHRGYQSLESSEKRGRQKELFTNACELARAVPAFTLRFSLTGRFWVEMERVLAKKALIRFIG
jgi:SynChlorMet cassette protein ScmC